MAKFTFRCSSCNSVLQKYATPSTLFIKCDGCGSDMNQQLPTLGGPVEVRETVDKYTNRSWTQDQVAILKERKEDHYWKVLVPRLVKSHSLKTALENGWIWVDDNNKIHIHDKPPSKR